MGQNLARQSRVCGSTIFVSLTAVLIFSTSLSAQSPDLATAREAAQQTTQSLTNPQAPGSIAGKVIDQSGVAISAAKITLSRGEPSIAQEIFTDENGQFAFAVVPPGPFHLTISSPELTPQTFDDTLQPGQTYTLPLVMLTVAAQVTEVRVTLSPQEQAELEAKDEEKQRVFGIIPNFYVSYVPNPAPLTRKLKFQMALKSATDPFTLGGVGVLAGIEQATNKWKQYGQGAQGYGKRYGASYADVAAGTFIGNAILPVVFKQDPRYFYKGKGSKRSRLLHAIAGTFVARSDNGNWGPNYSNVLGSVAAGGISNLYYPSHRRGIGLVFSTAAIRLGEITAASLFEEFLGPKLTSNVPPHSDGQP